ncbi:MAG: hypothetical protein WC943_14545 [Elusimicrobiota bacterium]|jgi:endoglucanase
MRPDRVIALFTTLTSVPTAPYFEAASASVVRVWAAANLGARVRLQKLRGGLSLSYKNAPGPSLILAAHLDHPAFHLSSVTRRGARAKVLGGLPREFLKGALVEAFSAKPKDNRPAGVGILLEGKGDRFPVLWSEPPAKGVRPAFAMLALPPAEVRGGWLKSRSIDDTLGCCLALEALRRTTAARAKTNLTVLLHRAEEVGFIGCLDLLTSGALEPGDCFISVETSRRMRGAVPGRGPVIRSGDKAGLFDPNLLAFLEETGAGLKGLRFQKARLTGGTCEATAAQTSGLQAGGLSIPLVNYHNRGRRRVEPEAVRLSDLEPAVALLTAAAKRFPAAHLRGSLLKRLTNLHRKMAPLLRTPF